MILLGRFMTVEEVADVFVMPAVGMVTCKRPCSALTTNVNAIFTGQAAGGNP